MEDLIMSLVKFSNLYPSLFDRFIENDMFDWTNKNFSNTNTTLPSVNIKESLDAFEVEVAAPGFEKTDFSIEQDNDILTVSSEKKIEKETKDNEQFTKKEISYQSFSRSFTLPVTVESEKITAKYENGILKIVIPKKEEAKPKPIKQIAIS